MNNYELSRLIVEDILQKVRSNESIMYMEYVRSVETLLNKHAAQQNVQRTACAKWLAFSILFNVVLLAVVLVSIAAR